MTPKDPTSQPPTARAVYVSLYQQKKHRGAMKKGQRRTRASLRAKAAAALQREAQKSDYIDQEPRAAPPSSAADLPFRRGRPPAAKRRAKHSRVSRVDDDSQPSPPSVSSSAASASSPLPSSPPASLLSTRASSFALHSSDPAPAPSLPLSPPLVVREARGEVSSPPLLSLLSSSLDGGAPLAGANGKPRAAWTGLANADGEDADSVASSGASKTHECPPPAGKTLFTRMRALRRLPKASRERHAASETETPSAASYLGMLEAEEEGALGACEPPFTLRRDDESRGRTPRPPSALPTLLRRVVQQGDDECPPRTAGASRSPAASSAASDHVKAPACHAPSLSDVAPRGPSASGAEQPASAASPACQTAARRQEGGDGDFDADFACTGSAAADIGTAEGSVGESSLGRSPRCEEGDGIAFGESSETNSANATAASHPAPTRDTSQTDDASHARAPRLSAEADPRAGLQRAEALADDRQFEADVTPHAPTEAQNALDAPLTEAEASSPPQRTLQGLKDARQIGADCGGVGAAQPEGERSSDCDGRQPTDAPLTPAEGVDDASSERPFSCVGESDRVSPSPAAAPAACSLPQSHPGSSAFSSLPASSASPPPPHSGFSSAAFACPVDTSASPVGLSNFGPHASSLPPLSGAAWGFLPLGSPPVSAPPTQGPQGPPAPGYGLPSAFPPPPVEGGSGGQPPAHGLSGFPSNWGQALTWPLCFPQSLCPAAPAPSREVASPALRLPAGAALATPALFGGLPGAPALDFSGAQMAASTTDFSRDELRERHHFELQLMASSYGLFGETLERPRGEGEGEYEAHLRRQRAAAASGTAPPEFSPTGPEAPGSLGGAQPPLGLAFSFEGAGGFRAPDGERGDGHEADLYGLVPGGIPLDTTQACLPYLPQAAATLLPAAADSTPPRAPERRASRRAKGSLAKSSSFSSSSSTSAGSRARSPPASSPVRGEEGAGAAASPFPAESGGLADGQGVAKSGRKRRLPPSLAEQTDRNHKDFLLELLASRLESVKGVHMDRLRKTWVASWLVGRRRITRIFSFQKHGFFGAREQAIHRRQEALLHPELEDPARRRALANLVAVSDEELQQTAETLPFVVGVTYHRDSRSWIANHRRPMGKIVQRRKFAVAEFGFFEARYRAAAMMFCWNKQGRSQEPEDYDQGAAEAFNRQQRPQRPGEDAGFCFAHRSCSDNEPLYVLAPFDADACDEAMVLLAFICGSPWRKICRGQQCGDDPTLLEAATTIQSEKPLWRTRVRRGLDGEEVGAAVREDEGDDGVEPSPPRETPAGDARAYASETREANGAPLEEEAALEEGGAATPEASDARGPEVRVGTAAPGAGKRGRGGNSLAALPAEKRVCSAADKLAIGAEGDGGSGAPDRGHGAYAVPMAGIGDHAFAGMETFGLGSDSANRNAFPWANTSDPRLFVAPLPQRGFPFSPATLSTPGGAPQPPFQFPLPSMPPPGDAAQGGQKPREHEIHRQAQGDFFGYPASDAGSFVGAPAGAPLGGTSTASFSAAGGRGPEASSGDAARAGEGQNSFLVPAQAQRFHQSGGGFAPFAGGGDTGFGCAARPPEAFQGAPSEGGQNGLSFPQNAHLAKASYGAASGWGPNVPNAYVFYQGRGDPSAPDGIHSNPGWRHALPSNATHSQPSGHPGFHGASGHPGESAFPRDAPFYMVSAFSLAHAEARHAGFRDFGFLAGSPPNAQDFAHAGQPFATQPFVPFSPFPAASALPSGAPSRSQCSPAAASALTPSWRSVPPQPAADGAHAGGDGFLDRAPASAAEGAPRLSPHGANEFCADFASGAGASVYGGVPLWGGAFQPGDAAAAACASAAYASAAHAPEAHLVDASGDSMGSAAFASHPTSPRSHQPDAVGTETPGAASDDETPGAASDDETPGAASDDETPGAASDDETPGAASDDETPGAASDDETPGAASDDETPGAASDDETPAPHASKEETAAPRGGGAAAAAEADVEDAATPSDSCGIPTQGDEGGGVRGASSSEAFSGQKPNLPSKEKDEQSLSASRRSTADSISFLLSCRGSPFFSSLSGIPCALRSPSSSADFRRLEPDQSFHGDAVSGSLQSARDNDDNVARLSRELATAEASAAPLTPETQGSTLGGISHASSVSETQRDAGAQELRSENGAPLARFESRSGSETPYAGRHSEPSARPSAHVSEGLERPAATAGLDAILPFADSPAARGFSGDRETASGAERPGSEVENPADAECRPDWGAEGPRASPPCFGAWCSAWNPCGALGDCCGSKAIVDDQKASVAPEAAVPPLSAPPSSPSRSQSLSRTSMLSCLSPVAALVSGTLSASPRLREPADPLGETGESSDKRGQAADCNSGSQRDLCSSPSRGCAVEAPAEAESQTGIPAREEKGGNSKAGSHASFEVQTTLYRLAQDEATGDGSASYSPQKRAREASGENGQSGNAEERKHRRRGKARSPAARRGGQSKIEAATVEPGAAEQHSRAFFAG
ncbi:hypothetical protein BESB_011830 [Besnoitia besnoiti]|uniref:AP2/ERF domain-containing protein n=1 Tax=Besnoitia besnoiti TaxID=94643 RepID=A0A2A9M8E6_BESBE|nr:hypothetical protein BESB_011830 [Besnoitia besnoiti]PFH32571.1 hypothetical protein BESB_011830 [Besnoitia besnoiti]